MFANTAADPTTVGTPQWNWTCCGQTIMTHSIIFSSVPVRILTDFTMISPPPTRTGTPFHWMTVSCIEGTERAVVCTVQSPCTIWTSYKSNPLLIVYRIEVQSLPRLNLLWLQCGLVYPAGQTQSPSSG